MKELTDLFYSKSERILFYVAGYTDAGNNDQNVESLRKVLKEGVLALERVMSKIGMVDTREIKTFYVEKSSKYKTMRVFYVETDIIPENAFILGDSGDDWTMKKWVSN